ncbi:beta-Ala-His dipeptidase [Parvimonas micra]|jgi:Xaa-His dipeptidase|uniref:beta-Ala-His dipeptidase n=1 Tax=Parvimonas micra TaxID=33033 RepID=UPI001E2FBE4E|nr:beta-Ala-His dipeptidase [Parvimonas micra]MCE3019403.1 beta-Ala-His dipeptidase [Parvimonas micra]
MNLKPERVFHYFREISDIPHESHNEKAISDYIYNFGKKLGLETKQDDLLNVYIRKPATKGYENKPGIILQGHMDMVCEKATSSNHNFATDKIEWVIKDDLIFANDTTLGADDGIAVAMAMAILEDENLVHPELEVIITVAEETTMGGALGLEKGLLKGKYLFNIDSEEEGILTLGSAGGTLFKTNLELKFENREVELVKLHFDGYFGGHSGMEIGKNRRNMIKTIAEFIKESGLSIASVDCGNKDNAIPRVGELVIENSSSLDELIAKFTEKYNGEEQLTIDKKEIFKGKVLTNALKDVLVEVLEALPTGVNTQDETGIISSSNLAIVQTTENEILIRDSIRSASISILEEMKNSFAKIAEKFCLNYEFAGGYPSWEKKENSSLQKYANKVYKDLTGKEFENIIIHAGLECGAIYEKYPNLELISFGPDIRGAHTPKENISISSTERVYDFTLKLIEEIAKN